MGRFSLTPASRLPILRGETPLLEASSVSPGSLRVEERRRLPGYEIPVVQVARLAVDLSARGQRIGGDLLLDALALSARTAELVGVFAVEVYAKDAAAVAFYRRFGFTPMTDAPLHLYLPMSAARALL